MIAVREENTRETLFRAERELHKGKSKPEGLGRGVVSSVTAACMSSWVTICPSVRADISVCLVLPYWLPETLLMSSLGACCHWLKRRGGVECVCVCV